VERDALLLIESYAPSCFNRCNHAAADSVDRECPNIHCVQHPAEELLLPCLDTTRRNVGSVIAHVLGRPFRRGYVGLTNQQSHFAMSSQATCSDDIGGNFNGHDISTYFA
jgi:hypothetical protein